jgi:hypothetical protein
MQKFQLVSHHSIALTLLVICATVAHAATPITDILLDTNNIQKWHDSNGDTWDPFWADDGNLYAFNCDGRGFGTAARNLSFNRLTGDTIATLAGKNINSMDDYGNAGKKEADNATWKVCGQECIDSIFYAFVSRNVYGNESADKNIYLRQTAENSSLIKSTDRGLTWTRPAAENYKSPMWPGTRFGSPFFIHYGKNGGNVSQDAADKFVYAISNNGFWNDGDDFIIARVDRKTLPAQSAADWTYYTGGDGSSAENWNSQITKAAPILTLPKKCGQSGPCYIPALHTYLLVSWYNTPKMLKWYEPAEMKYDFYQAAHPWGPWTFIRSYSDNFIIGGHMYGPSLCAKFQELIPRGTAIPGGDQSTPDIQLSLFTSGCPFEDRPSGLYKMWQIPLILKTTPIPPSTLINDDDPAIQYTGTWTALHRPNHNYIHDDLHSTTTPGDSLQYTFTGTGIDIIAERFHDLGPIAITLDGTLQQTLTLRLDNFPRLTQVTVFSLHNLPNTPHTIKILNKSPAYADLDAFRIYK